MQITRIANITSVSLIQKMSMARLESQPLLSWLQILRRHRLSGFGLHKVSAPWWSLHLVNDMTFVPKVTTTNDVRCTISAYKRHSLNLMMLAVIAGYRHQIVRGLRRMPLGWTVGNISTQCRLINHITTH